MAAVVATGHDTKQLLNALTPPPSKQSTFDRTVSKVIAVILFLLLDVCLALAFVETYSCYTSDLVSSNYESYLGPYCAPLLEHFIASFVKHLILLHNVIPVSLLATIQLIRLIQAHFIRKDENIFSELYNKGASVQNCQLNEMLGQVKYIFADKTGTITKNKLSFRQCSIGGQIFQAERDASNLKNILKSCNCSRSALSVCEIDCVLIKDFFTAICLCHTVIPHTDTQQRRFLAGSPDEKAVLQGANQFDIVRFEARTESKIVVSEFGRNLLSYEILHVFEYSSVRKKMTVIAQSKAEESEILVLTKGADSAVLPLLSEGIDEASLVNLERFASAGLRTMCYACKVIEKEAYIKWKDGWVEATSQLNRKKSLEEVSAKIERDLKFLGVTAVEDELQENAARSMRSLMEANIHVWMLSGNFPVENNI